MRELLIDGRPAVPVRLIPEVTGRAFSPDTLAMILAEHDDFFTEVRLTAYKLHADGSYTAVLPWGWDTVVLDLKDIADAVQRDKDAPDVEWREKACERLWPGMFVWLDDLNTALEAAYSPDRWSTDEQRQGDYKIDLEAPILPRIEELAYEGFETLLGIKKPPSNEAVTKPEGDDRLGLIFRRLKNGLWEFAFAGTSYPPEIHLNGYSVIGHLLQNPETKISAVDLARFTFGQDGPVEPEIETSDVDSWGEITYDLGDAGECIDPKARAEYRAEAESLANKIEEARSAGDTDAIERHLLDLEFIKQQISEASGLSGRTRPVSNHKERARKSVSMNGGRALKRLNDCCPELADYLKKTIKWGNQCEYDPKQATHTRRD